MTTMHYETDPCGCIYVVGGGDFVNSPDSKVLSKPCEEHERRWRQRRVDLVASDLYEPLDTTTPLNKLEQPLKYIFKYEEKRTSKERREG